MLEAPPQKWRHNLILTSIRIDNFRCFRQLRIEPLKRVNLLTGQNNTGKTCLLEALTLLLDEHRVYVEQLPRLFRADSKDFWFWLLYQKNSEHMAEITAAAQNAQFRVAVVHPKTKQAFPANWWLGFGSSWTLSQDLELRRTQSLPLTQTVAVATAAIRDPALEAREFNRVVFKRRHKMAEDFLRKIEPSLVALQPLLDEAGQPVICAELNHLPELIPVTQMGQGFGHLLKMISRILTEEAQVVLIDEIENGIHHSVLPVVWKGLADIAARLNVQIFATTHSWECIVAAHEAFAETLDYDFALHRLERVQEEIRALTYDREALEAAIKVPLEVR